jgi:hypothetical protein
MGLSVMRSLVPRTAMPGRSRSLHDQLARGLGYFSIALGTVELVAPRAVCGAAGLNGYDRLVQAYGAREVANGVPLLISHDATPWMWGRVAGDAADIATVIAGTRDQPSRKVDRALWALPALIGVTALDLACAVGLTSEKGGPRTARADYRARSGFPRGLQAARGAARQLEQPRDTHAPERADRSQRHEHGKTPGGDSIVGLTEGCFGDKPD